MTPTPPDPRIPTDDQFADMLRFVARTCLEVERGLRPPAHLTSLMAPSQRSLQPNQLGRFRGGPVRHDDIGRPQISRLNDAHIVANVVTRTEGERWGALTLELRPQDGRWRIAGLQRLLAVARYRTPRATAPLEAPTHDRRAHVAEARRMAEAAYLATTKRLAELTPGSPGYRAALDLRRHWQRTVRELDHRLAEFATRDRTAGAQRMLRR